MLHIEPYRDADRRQTAALIYAAFSDKFQRARRLSTRLQWCLFYRLWRWQQSGSRERSFVVKQDEQLVAAFALNAADGESNAGLRPRTLPIWRLCRRYGWWNVWRLYLQMSLLRHTPAADELYLSYLAVAENQRGKGVGKRLLQWMNDYAAGQGAGRRLSLHVSRRNVDAQRLYRRCGFQVRREEHYALLGLLFGQADWLLMERRCEEATCTE
ncbi:N-acetyltransferase [Serratia sp. FDAARGOS_506]|uniref:GNAT family N-acetyltransferase n=1 Tax=Serratia sp. FDAARGOS_506 TaxID=2420306 RepID=UPI000F5014D1|nr:GNAT family N-acetyltransferase [Serratia sp. FDAARGOS_506]AYZ32157.1 GNAT family N-acetyltransferase [Serratia sp. FDAARGOS_506]